MHPFTMPQSAIDKVLARQGRAHTCEDFEPEKTALVVVDMQYYFLEPGMLAAFPSAQGIVPNINRLTKAVRNAGGLVIWIQTLAPKPGLERQWWTAHERYTPEKRGIRVASLQKGAHAYDLWHDLDVDPADEVVIKRRYSAFIQGSSNIENVLDDRGVDTVLVTGVATNVCCESTARDAMMRNYRTVMVSDGNACGSDEEHAATLVSFYSHFGDVQTTEEIAAKFDSKAKNTLAAE